jgi:hypothetical protein
MRAGEIDIFDSQPFASPSEERRLLNEKVAKLETEFTRLERSGPGLRIPDRFYVPYYEGPQPHWRYTWTDYLYTRLLIGERPDPNDPVHVPFLENAAATELNYLIGTPVGGLALTELHGGLRNQTIGHQVGSTPVLRLFMHDTDGFLTVREPFGAEPDEDRTTFLDCVESLGERVGQLPASHIKEHLNATIHTLLTTGTAGLVELPSQK